MYITSSIGDFPCITHKVRSQTASTRTNPHLQDSLFHFQQDVSIVVHSTELSTVLLGLKTFAHFPVIGWHAI